MSQKGFAHILLSLIVVGVIIIAGAALWANYKNGHLPIKPNQFIDRQEGFEQNQKQDWPKVWQDRYKGELDPEATDCPTDVSKTMTYPLFTDGISRMTPIGVSKSGKNHVIPNPDLLAVPGEITNLFFPADMWILAADKHSEIDPEGNKHKTQYTLYMTPCRQILVQVEYIFLLSDEVQKIIDKSQSNCRIDSTPQGKEENCRIEVKSKFKAGDKIGKGGQKGLTIGVKDSRAHNPFISPDRYSFDHLEASCFFDYYSSPQKDFYYNLLKTPNGQVRTAEPRCGQVAQDIPGSAQGEWFFGHRDTGEQPYEQEGRVLSIVRYVFDPLNFGVLATKAGIVQKPGMFLFKVNHEGFVNRDPSEIKDFSNIYCFYSDRTIPTSFFGAEEMTGKVLVQLLNESTMKIEHQNGSCGVNEGFKNPFIYER